jgi:type I restriction-modification system DNA methylase subunit
MVDVMAPKSNDTICDPACGTGGFLLAAHDYITKHQKLDREAKQFLDTGICSDAATMLQVYQERITELYR